MQTSKLGYRASEQRTWDSDDMDSPSTRYHFTITSAVETFKRRNRTRKPQEIVRVRYEDNGDGPSLDYVDGHCGGSAYVVRDAHVVDPVHRDCHPKCS